MSTRFTTDRRGTAPARQAAIRPGFNEFFDGFIDNVFIYDEILSDQRLAQIRNHGAGAISGSVPTPPSLALLALALPVLAGASRRRKPALPLPVLPV